jgi:hypothetical protein
MLSGAAMIHRRPRLPHAIVVQVFILRLLRLQEAAPLSPARDQRAYRQQKNRCDDRLRPEAVDAPLLEDIRLDIA